MNPTQETSTPLNADGPPGEPKGRKLNRAQLREAIAMSRGKGTQHRADPRKAEAKKTAKRKTQRASRKANRK